MYQKFLKCLEESGKTIYQVCKETGIPASTLYMWKKRQGSVSLKTLVKIADYFEVTTDYFMKGESWQKISKKH